jgi:hypothetical protein
MSEDLLGQRDEIKCPNCRRWHPVFLHSVPGTTTAQDHLHFVCGDLPYYAGDEGRVSRHEKRAPAEVIRAR